MVYGIELFVRLKTTDLVALTAKNTLQRDMGYRDVLKDLKREDYWLISVECEMKEEVKELATEFANKTKIFVNPNKHTYTIRIRENGSEIKEEKGDADKGLYDIKVLVSYDEDSKACLIKDTLCKTLGYGDKVKDVKSGIIWRLLIDAEDEKRAKEVASDIVVTKEVKSGLLINPHSQSYRIL
ncbi:MAG: hypothetical protein QME40_06760 [bacterium]|nr:hypothetical protein [bacterium]